MSLRDVSLGSRIMLGFLPLIALGFGLVVVVARNQSLQTEAADSVRHTHEVISKARGLQTLVVDMETGQRGFVITGVDAFLQPYEVARAAWALKARELKELVSDNPEQVRRVGTIVRLEESWMSKAGKKAIEARRRSFETARELVLAQTGKDIVDSIRGEIDAFIRTEEVLLEERRRIVTDANERAHWLLVGGAILLSLAGVLLGQLLRRWALGGIQPLMRITDAVSAGATLHKIDIDRADEFGTLARSFNTMIDTLEREHRRTIHVGKLASIGQLAAGVGHEINNPLAAALGNVELAGRELAKPTPDLERLRQMNGRELQALERVARIVDGLRTHARLDENEPRLVDAHAAIKSTESLIGELYRKDGIEIVLELDAAYPTVVGHPGRLQQIVMNLLSNAKDAMAERASGQARVTTRNEGSSLLIDVADDGVGMEASVRARIFDAFFTTKPVGQGSGMGLSLVAQMVHDAGGEIDVSSQPNEGTTFTISLPVVMASVADSDAEPEAGIPERMSGLALVVDDEDAVRSVLRSFLEELGLDVHEAHNATTAFDRLSARRYDYVFSDLKMPDYSGDVLIEKAQAMPNGASRYFLITGGVDIDFSSERWSHIQTMVDGVISKPFTRETLRAALIA